MSNIYVIIIEANERAVRAVEAVELEAVVVEDFVGPFANETEAEVWIETWRAKLPKAHARKCFDAYILHSEKESNV